jgi:Tfp pilus assembly protein PilF
LAAALPAANPTFQHGVDLFIHEDYKAAQKAFEEALAADPKNPDYLLWLGRAYGRRAERATGLKALGAFSLAGSCRESFEQAVAIDPKHLPALQSLFDYYLNAPGIVGGGDDKAEALIPKMAAVNPATAERAKSALLAKREEFPQAEASLRKAIELEPDEIGHRLSLAAFLSRRGRFDESDKLFAEALRQHPDSPQVWFARAKELVRGQRNPAEARRLLERYLKTPLYAPDAEPYSDARSLLKEL